MTFSLLALTFSTAAALQAQAAPPSPQQVVRRIPAQAPKATVIGDTVTLPITYTAGLPTIAVSIAGKAYKLGFDTGAPGPLRLSEAVTQALGLTQIGELRASDPSGVNPSSRPLFKIAEFQLGSVKVKDWLATTLPLRPGKLDTLDGIIGLSAFDGYVVTIDYAANQLTIAKGKLPAADGKQRFAYDGDPIPTVPMTVDGKAIKAHVDTGNVAAALFVPADFAASLPQAGAAKKVGQAKTVSQVIDVSEIPVGSVSVGDLKLNVPAVRYPAVVPFGTLGSSALTGIVLKVDPASKIVQLERSAAKG